MLTSIFKLNLHWKKGGGLYQNKVNLNLNLTFTQSLGH